MVKELKTLFAEGMQPTSTSLLEVRVVDDRDRHVVEVSAWMPSVKYKVAPRLAKKKVTEQGVFDIVRPIVFYSLLTIA